MNKIKAFFGALWLWTTLKLVNLFFKKEYTEFQAQLAKAQETVKKNKQMTLSSIQDYYDNLTEKDKIKYNTYTKLQNELLRVYVQYCKEMQNFNGAELEEVRDIWVTTVAGLNKTFTNAFSHHDDRLIKKHLYAIQQECEIIINSEQEILPGYKGPVGNA